jgi:hypothetical protein
MPHLTATIGSDGPVLDLVIGVGQIRLRWLRSRATPAPPPVTARALIDTGSDLSVVHPQVLQQLGLQPTGSVKVRRPGTGVGFRPALLYDVQLALGGSGPDLTWISTRVVSVIPSEPTILALMGRDILARCTLFYNGPRDEFTLSH